MCRAGSSTKMRLSSPMLSCASRHIKVRVRIQIYYAYGFLRHGFFLWRPPLIFGRHARFCAVAGAAARLLSNPLLGRNLANARRRGEDCWTGRTVHRSRCTSRASHARALTKAYDVQWSSASQLSRVVLLRKCMSACLMRAFLRSA